MVRPVSIPSSNAGGRRVRIRVPCKEIPLRLGRRTHHTPCGAHVPSTNCSFTVPDGNRAPVGRTGRLSYEVTNAALGWAVIACLVLLAVVRALSGKPLRSGMAAAVVAVALVPPVISGHPTEMLAWEVLGLAALPVVLPSFGVLVGLLDYAAVATLALVVAVVAGALVTRVVMSVLERWCFESAGRSVSEGMVYLYVTGGLLLGGSAISSRTCSRRQTSRRRSNRCGRSCRIPSRWT